MRAKCRLWRDKTDMDSGWRSVVGPVSALLATARRIGWDFQSTSMLSDDRGSIYNLRVDPPVVIATAVRNSVWRWRLGSGARLAGTPPNIPNIGLDGAGDFGLASTCDIRRAAPFAFKDAVTLDPTSFGHSIRQLALRAVADLELAVSG